MMWMLETVYTTKAMRYDKAYIRKALAQGRETDGAVIIALDTDGDHPVEIVVADELLKDFYPERDLLVLGIAESVYKAQQLLVTMTDDVVAATGKADLASYYRELWENGSTVKITC